MFARRIVKVAALVEELDTIAESHESVGESRRNINLVIFSSGKQNARPFSEMRGTQPNVNGYIERFAFDHAAKLGLRMWPLIVQSAQRSFF